MNTFYLFLFLLAAGLNSTAQILLKKGALAIASVLSGPEALAVKAFRAFTNPFIAVAVILLATGMFLWIKIISRIELSRAYPINIALTVIITSVVAIFLFGESMSVSKAGGILLILLGIWVTLGA
ncbi:MAG: hypothetical protein A2946_02130 [Candidatus Liptonbacteria bacterium RIFCSPLOWO2_01_FULL_53_13]|uniref:EamA domain-containing protein n=1 Tax=Candidatus Liptonbacteria bacterium RIFCSPLOWO2_01_FULL_53_13 TaxID=1798651 RepID=A0A1G2CK61_9BACT|nr:MAG: hypothetical protein A2946_02130 [Candidatus Liptonbacteria bacterium RIFCSPLOWO2_01_FULL_53_13]